MHDVSFLHGRTSGPDQWVEEPVPVTAQQRWRILDATTKVLYEHGYAEVTVAHIVREARVSRRTFYENFENKQHVYLAAFSGAVECMAAAMKERYAGDTWAEKTAGGFAELARLLIEHPEAAHTCLVEVGAAGLEGENRRADALRLCRDGLGAVVDRDFGRAGATDPISLELAVGGLHGFLLERLRVKDGDGAAAEIPAVARAVLAPLVGADAADEVAACIPGAIKLTADAEADAGIAG